MFDHWAQPVTSKRWALICTILDRLFRPIGWFGPARHRAWQKACGL